MSNENKYICPKCKSENIQKCSILYDVHKKEINLNGESQGTGYQTEGGFSQNNTKTNSQGSIKNSLLEKVSPPIKPNIDESKLKLPEQPEVGSKLGIFSAFGLLGFICFIILEVNIGSGNNFDKGCMSNIMPAVRMSIITFITILISSIFYNIVGKEEIKEQEAWKEKCDKIKKEKQKEIDKEYNKKYKEWEQNFSVIGADIYL